MNIPCYACTVRTNVAKDLYSYVSQVQSISNFLFYRVINHIIFYSIFSYQIIILMIKPSLNFEAIQVPYITEVPKYCVIHLSRYSTTHLK